MTVTLPELWSEADSRAERALSQAALDSDLLSALVAIDGTEQGEAMGIAETLAGWSVEVRLERDAGAEPRTALATVLAQREGFEGDSEDYFAPENSSIREVIRRRRGQPILLSSIWILVGRGAGIEVVGVGLPGHFVVGVEGSIVDPFGRGRFLSLKQCRELAARAAPGRDFDEGWLEPVSVRAIGARVLRNLSHALRLRGDEHGVYRATRLLSALSPDDGAVWVELARQTEALGAWPEALALYRHIARHFSDRREGRIGELKAVELEQRSRVLN